MGRQAEGGTSRLWLERTRGSSKTTDVAVMALWPLAFSERKVDGIVAAGDKDQAGLLRAAIKRLLEANPWLKQLIEVNDWKVKNPATDSQLEIISSDAATSYGALVDFAVVDEVSHWTEGRGQELWVSILSTAAKKPDCLLIGITNAGWVDTWQWELREKIRSDPAWYFHALEGPAPWIRVEQLAEQERLLPPKEYRRLWLNQWVSSAGAEWPEEWFTDQRILCDRLPTDLVLKVVCLDPTQGKTARPGDYAAFVTLGVDTGGQLFAKAELHQGRDATWQATKLVGLYIDNNADAVGVETVMFQALIKERVDELARSLLKLPIPSFGLTVNRDAQANMPKPQRILLLTPYLSQGHLRIVNDEGGRLLVQQLRNFSTKLQSGQHDDGPDVLEQGVTLIRYLLRQGKDWRKTVTG